ncbi:ArsC family reductase [Gallaecimonas kandeliae]|uniref:ArsC family reductase n=1 Tax=Gallaecimonas kandeliae TaxID=3029055 RepID=UPI002649DB65|nr:ArsC family reductase [Gallaecimonas kandeliae]WKE64191.1 ArsC family reductase [Gallaecimonas kandeliae]
MTILYGIKNCDTIKKARKWLEGNAIPYQFHDYRVDGLSRDKLTGWAETLGWETLLNKRGTTFRQLPEGDKADLDQDKAVALMLEHPALIKRPLLARGETLSLGFKAEDYAALFGVKA